MGGIMMALLPVVLSMLANRGGGGAQPAGMARVAAGSATSWARSSVVAAARSAAAVAGWATSSVRSSAVAAAAAAAARRRWVALGGLLEQFQRVGYGEQARSWVGTGQNQPIPADVSARSSAKDGLAAIARQAGVSEQDASAGLSQLLPEVVDHVTPNGKVPDLDMLSASVDDLSRRFGLG